MIYLPIVDRELRVRARLGRTYWGRTMLALLVGGIATVKVYLLVAAGAGKPNFGRVIFETLSLFALVYAVLAGVGRTADSVSGEKREGTLGLLFLTDLKGHDVILGKLAAAVLSSLYALLGTVPVLAWCLLLGGVTFGEVARMGLSLIVILVFSLSVGTWVSVRSQIASRAMLGTLLVAAGLIALPLIGAVDFVAPLSPIWAWHNSTFAEYGAHWGGYWLSLLLSLGWSFLFIARASAIISRFCEEEGAVKSPEKTKGWWRRWRDNPKRRARLRTEQLERNPVMWLAGHNPDSKLVLWALVLVTVAGIAGAIAFERHFSHWPMNTRSGASIELILIIFILLMNAVVKTLLAIRACRCLAETRRNAMLETLLCAPLKVQDILQGQVLALLRQFIGPLVTLVAFEMAALFWLVVFGGGAAGSSSGIGDALIFLEGLFIIVFVLEILNIIWMGMWFGLSSRNESSATFKTVFFTVLLPYLTLLLSCVGVFFCVIWPVCTYLWVRLRLQQRFRHFAGMRPTSSTEDSGVLPFKFSELGQLSAEEIYAAEYTALHGGGDEQS